jgi:hypothetical protein
MSWFWWFMLAVALLIPLTMLILGLRWWRGRIPPYGGSTGYRTRRSLASPEAWVFAHVFFGRLWTILGAAALPVSLAAMLPCRAGDSERIGWWGLGVCLVQGVVMLAPMVATENALRRMGG